MRRSAEIVRALWATADTFVRSRLAIAVLLVSGASVVIAAAPVALKVIVDGFASERWHDDHLTLLVIACLYAASLWLARSLGELRLLVHGDAEQRAYRRFSEVLFTHVMKLPLRFHANRRSGALAQTFANGLAGYQLLLHHLVFSVIPVAIELLTVTIILLALDHPAFLGILLVSAVTYALVFSAGITRVRAPARAVSSAHVDSTAALTDCLLNYETVKYCNAESQAQRRYNAALDCTEHEWRALHRRRAACGLQAGIVFVASVAASILFAAQQVLHGAMTIGDLVLVNAYMLQLMRPLEMLGLAVRDVAQATAFVEKAALLLKEAPEDPGLGKESNATGPAALSFERLTFSYRAGQPVLSDVTFHAAPGTTLAFVGTSGAGKSSLIRLLMRFYDPDEGRILLDGVPLPILPLASLRQAIGVVPQDTILFNDTIACNIGLGSPHAPREAIEAAARVAHLHEFVTTLPEGYETQVGERGLKLSGGEKQRVSIARAALRNPRIFVFDEATSSLDTRTERDILRNLREISHGHTTLIVAHRLSTVVHAHQILVLDSGRIIERGTHDSLVAANGRYAAMWRAQESGASRVIAEAVHAA